MIRHNDLSCLSLIDLESELLVIESQLTLVVGCEKINLRFTAMQNHY